MENKNKFIALNYRLYVNGEQGKELMEETKADQPFQFITGFGITLDAFEKNVVNLEKGQDFSFSLETARCSVWMADLTMSTSTWMPLSPCRTKTVTDSMVASWKWVRRR